MTKKPRKRSRRVVVIEPPPPPVSPIKAFFQHLSWTWIVGTAAGISALLGVVVAYEKAGPIIEPALPSHRGYVRDYTAEETKKRTDPMSKWMGDYEAFRIEQTMEIAKLNLNTLNQNLLLAKKEQEANPNSQVVRDAVATLTKQAADTRKRIEDYESALFAKRATR